MIALTEKEKPVKKKLLNLEQMLNNKARIYNIKKKHLMITISLICLISNCFDPCLNRIESWEFCQDQDKQGKAFSAKSGEIWRWAIQPCVLL